MATPTATRIVPVAQRPPEAVFEAARALARLAARQHLARQAQRNQERP